VETGHSPPGLSRQPSAAHLYVLLSYLFAAFIAHNVCACNCGILTGAASGCNFHILPTTTPSEKTAAHPSKLTPCILAAAHNSHILLAHL
jgi:hypothetical protein